MKITVIKAKAIRKLGSSTTFYRSNEFKDKPWTFDETPFPDPWVDSWKTLEDIRKTFSELPYDCELVNIKIIIEP